MKVSDTSWILIVFLFLPLLAESCKKDNPTPPVITTSSVTEITENSAVSGGVITSDGGSKVISGGVCWSKSSQPSISDNNTKNDVSGGSYASMLTGLESGTTYYVRAYATNKAGTGYGSIFLFRTTPSEPVLKISGVSSITVTSAVIEGTFIHDMGITVLSLGICYNVKGTPTVDDLVLSSSVDMGNFSFSLEGLQGNTRYYVRPYAIFRIYGTDKYYIVYGSTINFISGPVNPMVTTISFREVWTNSATIECNVISNGGLPILSRGICLDTSPNPTIDSRTVSTPGDEGLYTIKITDLEPSKEYYVCAYASTETGTGYGKILKFKTNYGTVTDVSGNIYPTVEIGSQLWMKENLKTTRFSDGAEIPLVSDNTEWSLSGPACCWYNNLENETYGLLYNWYAVGTGKLCPEGWHIPTNDEWRILSDFLGGRSSAGAHLKEAGTEHWKNNQITVTNSSFFTALPGGWRIDTGYFWDIGTTGYWWSSTGIPYDELNVNCRILNSETALFRTGIAFIKFGLSVRCLKD